MVRTVRNDAERLLIEMVGDGSRFRGQARFVKGDGKTPVVDSIFGHYKSNLDQPQLTLRSRANIDDSLHGRQKQGEVNIGYEFACFAAACPGEQGPFRMRKRVVILRRDRGKIFEPFFLRGNCHFLISIGGQVKSVFDRVVRLVESS